MSKYRRGLGSGLSILLGNNNFNEINEYQEIDNKLIIEIDLVKIIPNKEQPRKIFDYDSLRELASSIAIHGVLQPILVAKDNEEFIIIAGERRYRASGMAGLTKIPAVVLKDKSAEEKYQISILENIQRENLSPVEEAEAYKFLIDNFNYTHEQLAEKLNKSRSYITNCLRILKLPEDIIDMISIGSITQGHAKVLSGLKENEVLDVAKQIESNQMSVRELELYIKNKKNCNKKGKDTILDKIKNQMLTIEKNDLSIDKNVALYEIGEALEEFIGYKTEILDKEGKIYLNIKVNSVKDLSKMIDIILNGSINKS